MKLTTTFWSEEVHTFEQLLYINGKNKEIIFQTNLNNAFETFAFFKKLASFVKNAKMRKTIDFENGGKKEYYQFAVLKDGKVTPICWFDLIISKDLNFSHDFAFNTTMVYRNGELMPFGRFPMSYYQENIKISRYREFKLKARIYKYLANQVVKNCN